MKRIAVYVSSLVKLDHSGNAWLDNFVHKKYLCFLTFDQTKVDRELGRDLLDEVTGDIEGVEGNILHQEENCIRKLGQLTLAQVCKEGVIMIRSEDCWSFVRSRCVLIRVSDISVSWSPC